MERTKKYALLVVDYLSKWLGDALIWIGGLFIRLSAWVKPKTEV